MNAFGLLSATLFHDGKLCRPEHRDSKDDSNGSHAPTIIGGRQRDTQLDVGFACWLYSVGIVRLLPSRETSASVSVVYFTIYLSTSHNTTTRRPSISQ